MLESTPCLLLGRSKGRCEAFDGANLHYWKEYARGPLVAQPEAVLIGKGDPATKRAHGWAPAARGEHLCYRVHPIPAAGSKHMRMHTPHKSVLSLFVVSSVMSAYLLFPSVVSANRTDVQVLLEKAVANNTRALGGGLLAVSVFDPVRGKRCARSSFVAGRRAGAGSPLLEKGTPYGIASITKTLVATLVLMYVERGLLDLDSPVISFFKNGDWILEPIRNRRFKRNLESVTVRHLLSHRSGFPDYWDNDDFFKVWAKNRGKYWSHLEVLRWAGNMRPECAVGKCFNYGDTNYLIMGMILERKLGKALHVLLREEIFNPLKMQCSWMYFEEKKPKGCKAVAHSFEGRLDVTRNRMQSADWASGGVYSTLEDQTAFFSALFFTGKLLSEQSRTEMWNWRRANRRTKYGLGIYRVKLGKDMTLIGHEGLHNAFAFVWEELGIVFTGTLNQEKNNAVDDLLYPIMRGFKKEGSSSWAGQAHEACAAR